MWIKEISNRVESIYLSDFIGERVLILVIKHVTNGFLVARIQILIDIKNLSSYISNAYIFIMFLAYGKK